MCPLGRRSAAWLAVALVCLLMSGCVREAPIEGGSASPNPSHLAPAREKEASATPTGALDVSDCQFVLAGLMLDPRPPSWPRPPDWPDASMPRFGYSFYECNRLSWAHYERGPVGIMFEGEQLDIELYGCSPDRLHDVWLTTRVYVDDAELADAWAAFFGGPVSVVNFGLKDVGIGPLNETRLTWEGEQVSPSTIVLHHGPRENYTYNRISRFIWFNETSLTTLDLTATFNSVDPQALFAVGQFGEPSPLAKPIEPEIVYVVRDSGLHGTGEITTWDNHDCRP